MQRERPKPAKVASPSRRPALNRLADARNSERKRPKGMKAAMLEIISAGPRPILQNNLEKSNPRS